MTTVTNPVLPIPEDTIQGTGSYTVPANKYGFLSGSVNCFYRFVNLSFSATNLQHYIAGHQSNNLKTYIKEGDTVSVFTSAQDVVGSTSPPGLRTAESNAEIRLNSQQVCKASASGSVHSDVSTILTFSSGSAYAGWNLSLYPIPKNNLPLNLIEGN